MQLYSVYGYYFSSTTAQIRAVDCPRSPGPPDRAARLRARFHLVTRRSTHGRNNGTLSGPHLPVKLVDGQECVSPHQTGLFEHNVFITVGAFSQPVVLGHNAGLVDGHPSGSAAWCSGLPKGVHSGRETSGFPRIKSAAPHPCFGALPEKLRKAWLRTGPCSSCGSMRASIFAAWMLIAELLSYMARIRALMVRSIRSEVSAHR